MHQIKNNYCNFSITIIQCNLKKQQIKMSIYLSKQINKVLEKDLRNRVTT